MRFASSAATALAAFSGVASASPLIASRIQSRQEVGLNSAIQAAGKEYFGTSLTIRGDQTEVDIITNPAEFGSITPENDMKWDSTQGSQGQYTFDGADAIADFATQNNMEMRCHTLVWHSQLPSWVSNGGFNNETLIEVMRDHITTVAGRYKGQCTHWDVVNEALNEDGTWRDSVFHTVIGKAFIPIAFRIAAEVDPDAKLYYNDYNLEYNGPKAKAAREIVELVQSYGLRIDGVGLQAHLTIESTPTNETPCPDQETLEDSLRLYTSLGVDVAYTELDIRMNTPVTDEKLAIHADVYARVTRSCMAVDRCVGITVWGVSDQYSWVPGTFPGEDSGLLWDGSFNKKPAYDAVIEAIQTGGNGTQTGF
ncbi:NAD(P)H-dependent D-xylose reductase (XR) [Arachnomyces sp. PD_36]|nr:NAD(P)H-dependent D-xylose reductase (XR) [Arachnomyces sp. PD_36]